MRNMKNMSYHWLCHLVCSQKNNISFFIREPSLGTFLLAFLVTPYIHNFIQFCFFSTISVHLCLKYVINCYQLQQLLLLVGVPLKQCRWWPQLFCDLKYLGRLLSSWGFISTPDEVRLSYLCLIVQHLCFWDLESSFEMLPQSGIKIPVPWACNTNKYAFSLLILPHLCLFIIDFSWI